VFAYAVSLSVLLQVIALPVLGALADRPLAKRRLLVVSTAVGSAATVALALTPPGTVLPGTVRRADAVHGPPRGPHRG